MTKLWKFIKGLFGKKELPTVPEDVVANVMRMVRRNINLEDRARLKEIFDRLNPGSTRIVMERLDHVERRLLLALLG